MNLQSSAVPGSSFVSRSAAAADRFMCVIDLGPVFFVIPTSSLSETPASVIILSASWSAPLSCPANVQFWASGSFAMMASSLSTSFVFRGVSWSIFAARPAAAAAAAAASQRNFAASVAVWPVVRPVPCCVPPCSAGGMCATDSAKPSPNESLPGAEFETSFSAAALCFAILFRSAMFAAVASLSSTARGIFSCERLNGCAILPAARAGSGGSGGSDGSDELDWDVDHGGWSREDK